MKVSELIVHLQQLPQDADVNIVVSEHTGEDAAIKDICFEQIHHLVVLDSWSSVPFDRSETRMSYEIARSGS